MLVALDKLGRGKGGNPGQSWALAVFFYFFNNDLCFNNDLLFSIFLLFIIFIIFNFLFSIMIYFNFLSS